MFCPIGIGECLCCVLGRMLALVTGWEAQSACHSGVDQLASGMQSVIEGAIHAISALYVMIILMMAGVSF